MNIEVIRKYKKADYTIGQMLVDGKFLCNTLEDTDRGLRQGMTLSQLKKIKVYGKTAIPYGTYKMRPYFWPKHRKTYPLLLDVPAYSGVLIHGGVTHADTLGCILVGENKERGKLTNCAKYVRQITKLVQDCESRGEECMITIREAEI